MYRLCFYALLTAGVALAAPAAAQTGDTPVRARAAVDSSYAVALEVERLAEAVRTGETLAPHLPDAGLKGAIATLASAAPGRRRRRPQLPAVWDFRLEVVQMQAPADGRLAVTAHAYLATDPTGPKAPVTLHFQRDGTAWVLAQHEGLVPALRGITQRLGRTRP
jgi:hypothetical protein